MKRSAQRLWLRSAISKCPVHERICFLGLVLFSAVARAIWNSLVKSAGDRRLTMVMIRFTGSCWALRPSRSWIGHIRKVGSGYSSRLAFSSATMRCFFVPTASVI